MDCERYRKLYTDPNGPPKDEIKDYIEHRRQCSFCRAFRLGVRMIAGDGERPAGGMQRTISGAVSRPAPPQEPEPSEFDPNATPNPSAEFDDLVHDLQEVLTSKRS